MGRSIHRLWLVPRQVAPTPDVYWDTNRDGTLDGTDAPLSLLSQAPNADGMTLSMARNIGDRVGVAINGFFPSKRLMMFGTTEPSLPTWVMFGNRTQRVDLSLGLGAELFKGLSLGASVEVVAMARYQILGTIDVGVGASETEEDDMGDLVDDIVVDIHEMSLDIIPRAIPIFGFHWDVGRLIEVLDGAHLGASWRAASGIPIDAKLDLQVNGTLADLGELEEMSLTIVMPVELIFLIIMFRPVGLWCRVPIQKMALGVCRCASNAMVGHAGQCGTRHRICDSEPGFQSGRRHLVDDANQYTALFSDTTDVHAGTEIYLPTIDTQGKANSLEPVLRFGLRCFRARWCLRRWVPHFWIRIACCSPLVWAFSTMTPWRWSPDPSVGIFLFASEVG